MIWSLAIRPFGIQRKRKRAVVMRLLKIAVALKKNNDDVSQRATVPVLTSDKEENHVILHTTLNFIVRKGKLRRYTLQNPPEAF